MKRVASIFAGFLAVAAAGPVSVCRDATYTISGSICSGSGVVPAGQQCPQAGSVATQDCHPYLPSWNAATSSCVLKESATCVKLTTGAWGCVLPSVGCGSQAPTKKKNQQPFVCDPKESTSSIADSWNYSETDTPSLATATIDTSDSSWFESTTTTVKYEVGCANGAKLVPVTTPTPTTTFLRTQPPPTEAPKTTTQAPATTQAPVTQPPTTQAPTT
ncbi:unnamed protein product, partial [Aphanomyces euteiches]